MVEECDLAKGLNPFLDSLVVSAMREARFAPAYESGKAVPATVSFQLGFDLATILANSSNAAPELCGVAIDRSTGKPLGGATINFECMDSTADPDITIGTGRYLELIGNLPGQSCYRGVISTTADSRGAFSLRLLPGGPVRMAVMARGYEPGHFTQQVRPGMMKSAIYYLDPLAIMEGDSIVVFGRQERRSELNIEEQQHVSGLTTYLSETVKSQTVITGVPEAASLMSVQGGSPFDNRYLICGVPFLAPFHFGGHPYADIDGMMISSLKRVNVTVDRIAGTFPEASGILIEANPGIYRSNNRKLIRRPEMAVDYGLLSQDFMVSLPASSHDNDYVQLGYSGSKDYHLTWLESLYTSRDADIGIGSPVNMGSLTLTGTKTMRTVQADAFGWFAWDFYTCTPDRWALFPWGMASVSIRPTDCETPLVRYGGSHQYFMDGKRVGNNAFLKTVYLSNGSVSLHADSLVKKEIICRLDYRVDYENWRGSLVQRDARGLDTGISAQGHGGAGHVHCRMERESGPISLSGDLLGSLFFDNRKELPEPVLDAGVSMAWKGNRFQAGLHGGRVTSRPDIRGLPDSLLRRKRLHVWLLSIPLEYGGHSAPLRLSVQPYFRFQDRAPGMNPLLYSWDDGLTTAVLGQGVAIGGEIQPHEWVSWNGAVNLSRAERIGSDTALPYEGNTPWTVRSGLRLNYRKKLHLYLKGMVTSMAPYYDFTQSRYAPLPHYVRWDIKLQYRTERPKHRYLTRYDGYFNINNVTDTRNIRDYYWDARMVRHPVFMSGLVIELGIRLGFRL
ncbi:MAG: hypothetical protein JXA71_19665 [Chitinispirillaceae bacterium]|nr:hypothetical protein [Chitinispirillaceae bacterium]